MRTLFYRNTREGFGKVGPNLRFFDLRVINRDVSAFGEEVADESDCGRFAGVTCVGFEGKAKNSNVLSKKEDRSKRGATIEQDNWKYFVGNCVEERVNDTLREAPLLMLVHGDNLAPICRNFRKVETFRKINEIENIFLETGATESDRSAQKFRPNSRVFSDGVSDFLDVGSGRLANGGKRIDGRYTLGQHRVGR